MILIGHPVIVGADTISSGSEFHRFTNLLFFKPTSTKLHCRHDNIGVRKMCNVLLLLRTM